MFAHLDDVGADSQGHPSGGDQEPAWRRGLNLRQLDVVTHPGGPLLVLAGAGTGKTRALASRVARLVAEGTAPDRILLLTFTRRAATEMLARVGAMTDHRATAQVWGGTFHAVANRLLRRHGPAIGLSPAFTVLDQADATDLVGLVRTSAGLGEGRRRFPRPDTMAAIYTRVVNAQVPLDDVLAEAFPWCRDHHDDLAGVFAAYTERKRRHHLLDFDDLLLFWRAMVCSPDTGPALRATFDHILVDEYQDTNALQADIVAALGAPCGNVTAVGDDAQAIYGFRAATAENMARFTTTFPTATVIALEQNYRSVQPILDLANAVLADAPAEQRPDHLAKVLWTQRPGTVRPRLVTCHDELAQSAYVCDTVLALREEGIDLRHQAVLFRTGHHSDALELELARRDIPFVKYGGLRFLEAAHIKDVMALLRVVDNPADQLAWHRALDLLEGVGPATRRRLHGELGLDDEPAAALSRFLAGDLGLPAPARQAAGELRAAWSDCSTLELGPADAIDRLTPFCVLTFPGRYADAPARLADLVQLARSAPAGISRSRFLTELTLDPPERTGDRAGPPHLDDDYLVLSTIHSAKGCEWRAVHLIGAADGNLPSDMALGDRDGLAEERRLTYVALTRARDHLTVTFPLRFHVHRHGRDDRHHLAQLSRFLQPQRHLFDEIADHHEDGPTGATLPRAEVPAAAQVDALLQDLWRR